YMPKQFRRALGVVMRKLRKEDYRKPESYRVINLLDMWGKVLERIVARRLEKWGKKE
ncbi:hypothetical protein C7212DRAFT_108495, partial [Tuber magnatum]